MNHIKYLISLISLCLLSLFISCDNSDDPVAVNDTSITDEDNTTDDSTDDSTDEISSQILTSSSNIEITKSWTGVPDGYTYPMNISVPTDTMPSDGFPVCILLHGKSQPEIVEGENGVKMIQQWSTVLTNHALVAPSGYMGTWNLCAEDSKAADIEMVDTLVLLLQQYTNINPDKIRILGSSNGAGLTNSVFIENRNPSIDAVCAVVSHLNTSQYHLDDFYKQGNVTDSSMAYCGYEEIAEAPLTSRRYLNISNDNDPEIPYSGGYRPEKALEFLHAQDAIYIIAQNHGYDGEKLPDAGIPIGTPVVFEYSYLFGDVVHIRGNALHGTNETQDNYIKDFFDQ
ncbi:hypothetical protein OAA00_09280 [Cyclobacteriaceae bacterium]|nr:hypothetical protein [Cyclobacteriaceae bacterium]MDB4742671.1 hypothetical protein [Cyclobacteriaceae bacterium]